MRQPAVILHFSAKVQLSTCQQVTGSFSAERKTSVVMVWKWQLVSRKVDGSGYGNAEMAGLFLTATVKCPEGVCAGNLRRMWYPKTSVSWSVIVCIQIEMNWKKQLLAEERLQEHLGVNAGHCSVIKEELNQGRTLFSSHFVPTYLSSDGRWHEHWYGLEIVRLQSIPYHQKL